MEIRQILLKNFKQFSQGDFSFTSGLNIVKGPNESGKSTLHEAIVVALLDRPTGKQSEGRNRSWGQERLYEVKLSYLLPSGEGFVIYKDFEECTHEVLGPNDLVDSSRSGLKRAVQKALGTTSEKLFSSTVSIRQDAMMDLDKGGKEISTQMQEIAMGGVSGVNDAINRLENKVLEFERGWKTNAPRNPGPISLIKKQIADVDEHLQVMGADLEKRELAQEELFQQRKRITAIDRELETFHELRSSYTGMQELKRDLDKYSQLERELEEKIERMEGVEVRKVQIQARLEKLKHFRALSGSREKELLAAREGWKARWVEAKDREKRIFELKKRRDDEGAKRKDIGLYWVMGMILLGISLGSLNALSEGFLESTVRTMLLIVGGVLTLTGSLWLVGLFARRIRRAKNLAELLSDAQERYERGLAKLTSSQDDLKDLLGPFGCETWEEFENNLDNYKKLHTDLEMAETTLTALLGGGGSLSALEDQRREASRARRDIQEKLAEFGENPELTAVEYQRICNDIERLENERQERQERIIRLEALSQKDGNTLDDYHRSMERVAALQHRLDHALDRYKVYQMTLEGLRDVRDQILENAQHELEPLLRDYLEHLTQGRYHQAQVDKDLQIQISRNSKGNRFISVDDLSSGTRDQVYLAARLALCDMIFPDAKPPILMDDPFIKFDPDRRDAALRLCKELSANRQIILFTCHDGYDAYADHLISLG